MANLKLDHPDDSTQSKFFELNPGDSFSVTVKGVTERFTLNLVKEDAEGNEVRKLEVLKVEEDLKPVKPKKS